MEITDNNTHEHFASNAKGNTALTLGIIGTALGALNTVGNGFSLFGGNSGSKQRCSQAEDKCALERRLSQDYLDLTTQYYEGKIAAMQSLNEKFYALDRQDNDNLFTMYKYSRDNRDELCNKINDLQSKVDIMAAVRPYQDALIDAKIRETEFKADYNLSRRTCKMLEGQLVLVDSSIQGFPGTIYNNCSRNF